MDVCFFRILSMHNFDHKNKFNWQQELFGKTFKKDYYKFEESFVTLQNTFRSMYCAFLKFNFHHLVNIFNKKKLSLVNDWKFSEHFQSTSCSRRADPSTGKKLCKMWWVQSWIVFEQRKGQKGK